ncbi:MAG: 2-oxoglutarate dehydrogenase E2 component (dihydrolipoamide succinyltransferase) [Granulosicoccus sp.]|jgi:2-oxoglutarate dehydrogenase E2 component (dihydrolipoamide succinyltransferase)
MITFQLPLRPLKQDNSMAKVEVIMPKMGESVAEATIIKWCKEVGETIESEESILEIATDKVDSEIPSPVEGVLAEKLCEEGDVVAVGAVVGYITTDVEETGGPTNSTPAPAPEKALQPVAAAANGAAVVAESATVDVVLERKSDSGKFYSPLVRSMAKAEGIGMSELESISGSGKEGRVTKHDMLDYIPNRTGTPASAPAAKPAKAAPTPMAKAPVSAPAIISMEGDEIVEMDRMRKLISDHMVMSKHTSPHVTSFVEADVTNIVNWRNKIKDDFLKREGEKLTFTPIFIEAIAQAISEMRGVNVSTDGQNVIKRKHINIGMATALPSGNLIVPVIKDADQKNLLGLTKSVNDLANRSRNNKLIPEDIQGGTYTMTNVGTFGNVMGTPIINQPQVAILALGAIRKKPAVIETPQGDLIGIRHMMFLSHSYDHRVVDGALGGKFVQRVAQLLESFDPDRTI